MEWKALVQELGTHPATTNQPQEQDLEPRGASVSSPSSSALLKMSLTIPAIAELLDSFRGSYVTFGSLVGYSLIANGLPLAKMQSKLPGHNIFHLFFLLFPT